MKKIWMTAAAALVLGASLLTGTGAARSASAEEITADCKAAYLMDDATGVQM